MAHETHTEYREEFQGEHPNNYDHSEPRYTAVAILGGLTALTVVIVGIAVQGYYARSEEKLIYDTVLSQPNWVLRDLRNKEAWELSHYAIFDKTKGTVRLPIDQAMKLVIQDAAENRLKYPTNPYAPKAETTSAPVSQPGAAALQSTENSGVVSSPNVQGSSVPQQVHK